ncbi:MAG: iron ABC transporter permease [Pseudomonadota bacterium]
MQWVIVAAMLMIGAAVSLTVGVRAIEPNEYMEALWHYDPFDPAHVTIVHIRLPRFLAAIVVGAALGIAGLVMQALSRNPLADPGILGVNAGAAFALVLGTALMSQADQTVLTLLAFPGAAVASIVVFALGGGLKGDAGPVRLTLAGAAVNAFLLSSVTAVVLVQQETFDVLRFWVAGSLSDAAYRPLTAMAVVIGLATVLAFAIAPSIETLSLGTDLARGLGMRPGYVQAGALTVVTLATGADVSVAGPIAFLGLLAPHLATRVLLSSKDRSLRYRMVMSAALGAFILMVSDVLGRLILAPEEVRAGVVVALLGGPVFVWIARSLKPGATA